MWLSSYIIQVFKAKLLFIIHVIIQFSSDDYKWMSKDLSFSRSFMTTDDLKFSIWAILWYFYGDFASTLKLDSFSLQ